MAKYKLWKKRCKFDGFARRSNLKQIYAFECKFTPSRKRKI
ncbi:hypothetical protein CAMSH0001_1089 [Campylobacter showae RM3277]|uniref:Uncharacterized protein n=1 Tax=Campylobacter showae RM3277 TaxID=553219 RepID=C6RHX9_9BACT|nr:hypothetical protein CAMSH0001_1089 [Campylobacter showae RM3277]